MGIGEDFARFRTAYNIDRETVNSISYRYRRITRQLNRDFWGIDSETAHSLYVGSYGRDTAASGVSDLDVGFLLHPDLYYQYDRHAGNGQSALLQAVKRSIQKTYVASESFGDGQVVVVKFTDGITFEILPAFPHREGHWVYPNANAGGYWAKCNPRAEMEEIRQVNQAVNHNLKYLCRMMRIWRDYHGVPMSGMLIDTLAYRFIVSWEHRDKSFLYHDFMARDYFAYLANQRRDQAYWLAPGSNSQVYRKGPFERAAAAAHAVALESINYDTNGNVWSRRSSWRKIFGPPYPNSD